MKKSFLNKLSVFTFFSFMLFGFAISGFAQNNYRKLDINGHLFSSIQTRDSIVIKFGEPEKYWSKMTEAGLDEEYWFNQSFLRFTKNGNFVGFALKDNRFSIYTFSIAGGIKVGDSISKFNQLGFGALIQKSNNLYLFTDYTFSDYPVYVFQANGIITSLEFSY